MSQGEAGMSDEGKQAAGDGYALAVTWEAKPGEAEAVADILRRVAAASNEEPGVRHFIVHRSVDNDHLFFLYELYADEAALEAHQQTEHFKTLVLGQAVPRLARRERQYLRPLPPAG